MSYDKNVRKWDTLLITVESQTKTVKIKIVTLPDIKKIGDGKVV